jgi:hypothetical protein
MHTSDMKRFNLKKQNEADSKKEYQAKIPKYVGSFGKLKLQHGH